MVIKCSVAVVLVDNCLLLGFAFVSLYFYFFVSGLLGLLLLGRDEAAHIFHGYAAKLVYCKREEEEGKGKGEGGKKENVRRDSFIFYSLPIILRRR